MEYKHDSVVPFAGSDKDKKAQVAEMFDTIAHRYDFLNRFLSGGIDVGWRIKALRQLKGMPVEHLLDVATGTADVALMAMKYVEPAPKKITGIDISEGMLDIGRQKIASRQLSDTITLYTGDSEAISFADDTFDAITVAFGVRNFANLKKGLAEMRRVLKPGGKLVVLEFSKPAMPGVKQFYSLYTRWIAPKAGGFFSGSEKAYRYLNNSIMAFPEGNAFLKILQEVGYTHTYKKTLSLGICTIYCGSK